ncbi:DUF4224 domain-containing protein [Thauera humireducens]|uniref:DUF4224 domain-containing protein n=1 Tax=Thauera humireducens TaxID=1134435 RepID=UPI003C75F3A6
MRPVRAAKTNTSPRPDRGFPFLEDKPVILSDEQLEALTRKKFASAQCRVLSALGIPTAAGRMAPSLFLRQTYVMRPRKRDRHLPACVPPSRSVLAGQAR